MIKFIYFDLGKVVFDHNRVFEGLVARFGLNEDQLFDEFIRYKAPLTAGRLTPQDFWERVRKDLHIAEGEDFDFTNYWVDQYVPRPEIHACMMSLHDTYKVGLLSNIYANMWPLLLSKHIVPDMRYDATILSCEVGCGKPDKKIYEIAQKKAGVEPGEILYIDDKAVNLDAAGQAGWNVLQFDKLSPSGTVSQIYTLVKTV